MTSLSHALETWLAHTLPPMVITTRIKTTTHHSSIDKLTDLNIPQSKITSLMETISLDAITCHTYAILGKRELETPSPNSGGLSFLFNILSLVSVHLPISSHYILLFHFHFSLWNLNEDDQWTQSEEVFVYGQSKSFVSKSNRL